MANKGGLASFVGKNSRHGPTSVHGQPDSQTIRHVEAYMARVVPGSVHHDSVSRDMWATDVESIANTTTANMSDAVKSEEEPYQDVSIGTQMETEEVDAERNTDSDVEYSNDDDEDDDKAMVQPVGAVMTTVHHRVVAQAPVQPSLRSTNQPQYRPRGGQDGRVIERQSDPTISQKNEQKVPDTRCILATKGTSSDYDVSNQSMYQVPSTSERALQRMKGVSILEHHLCRGCQITKHEAESRLCLNVNARIAVRVYLVTVSSVPNRRATTFLSQT
jgi:hypothetical protein